ncbi:MAG: thiamine biosynthesis lipoprotein [Bacteroidia bacterium]|jgi:thiamine biosynthesis lipoprotein
MVPGLAGLLVPAAIALPSGAAWAGSVEPHLAAVATAPVLGALLAKDAYLTEQEALALFFPTATRFERGIALPEGLAERDLRERQIPRHFFRYAAYRGDELLGYGVVDNVLGKSRPITYLLATDAPDDAGHLRALGVEILVYRESHGFEVDREAFRKQFIGKGTLDSLTLKDDIRNVAGATISCRSVTDGVHDLLTLLESVPVEVQVAAEPHETLAPDLDAHEEATHLTRTRLVMNAPLRISIELDPSVEMGITRAAAIAVSEEAFALVASFEGALSRFDEKSVISQINRAQGTPLKITEATHGLLERAVYWAKQSGGAFDPVAGGLARLWKEAGAMAPGVRIGESLPAKGAIDAARKTGGFGKLKLVKQDGGSGFVASVSKRGAELDLGACAKGHALDELARLLQERGVTQACIDFGGQLLVIGDAHRVDLRDMQSAPSVMLAGGSLATTGDAERGLVIDGTPHSHVIDPRTGLPALGAHTVTVFAASALDADILSTLLFVLGLEDGKAFAEARGIAARFSPTISPGDSAMTSAWAARFSGKK